MAQQKTTESKPVQALRKIAMKLPEAEEGTSCNKIAFKARKKAFLYVGGDEDTYNVMLNLGDSLAEATALGKKQPDSYSVGGIGWVTVTLPAVKAAPKGLFERWVEESFRLLAPKRLVAELDGGAAPAKPATKAKAGKKTARKKSARK